MKTQSKEQDQYSKLRQEYENIYAARNFLKMSEQRDTLNSLDGLNSERSTLGPNMEEYINLYKSEKDTNIGGKRDTQGLTEQIIKKNTLDKDKGKARNHFEVPDVSQFDNESQHPEHSVFSTRPKEPTNISKQQWDKTSEVSKEFS